MGLGVYHRYHHSIKTRENSTQIVALDVVYLQCEPLMTYHAIFTWATVSRFEAKVVPFAASLPVTVDSDDHYLQAAKEGPDQLLKTILTDELAVLKALEGARESVILSESKAVVFSMEPYMLKAILTRDLAYKFVTNLEVCGALNRL